MPPRIGTPVGDPFINRFNATSSAFWQSVDIQSNDPSFASNWMPPAPPQPIVVVVEEAREKDYPAFYNLNENPLSGRGGVTIQVLRSFSDNCEVLRSIIETAKNQITTLGWDFHLKGLTNITPDDAKRMTDTSPEIKRVKQFFKKPDGRLRFRYWMRKMLEEIIVLDFLCIYREKNLLGDPLHARIIDADTILKKIDKTGETPLPPSIAYQQKLKGVVTKDFTTDEMIVFHRNPRVSSFFGFSQVEMGIHLINIALRRSNFQMNYYTEGSIPDMLLRVTEKWTDEQVAKYQKYFDKLMAGDLAARRRIKFIPDGIGEAIQPQKDNLKDEFDEWIARVFCHLLGVSPTPFIKNLNRSTGESSKEQADEEGKLARIADVKEVMDWIIEEWLGIDNVEAVPIPIRSEDSLKQAEIDASDVKNGIRSRDEVRSSRGLPPAGIGLTVTTSHGVVSLVEGEKDHVEISKTDIDTEKGNPNFKEGASTGDPKKPVAS
jgi:hypothetical protein